MATSKRAETLSSSAKFDGLYKNEEVRQNLGARLLNIEEASNYLNIGRSTMYSLLNTKKIKAIKIGKRTLIDIMSLNEFINSRQEYEGGAYGF